MYLRLAFNNINNFYPTQLNPVNHRKVQKSYIIKLMTQSKIKHLPSIKQLFSLLALVGLLFVSQTHSLVAQSVAQGYASDETLQRGMIVMLKKDDKAKITVLTNAEITKMLGVVIGSNDSPITVSADNQKIIVANSGRHEVLVSDQNGGIKQGDYVTISAISGIGMKTSSIQSFVLGKALADFDGKKAVLSSAKLKDGSGKDQTVNIGLLLTDIDIARNPSLKVEAHVPEILRKASESIAQKEVAAPRIYIGMIILFVTAIVAGFIIYAGVRSSIISLGRNPLSRKTILRSLFQVIVTSLIIFLCGIFGVYLLLKL